MVSELAKKIVTELFENQDKKKSNIIDRVLREHGVTDDLVEQHQRINKWVDEIHQCGVCTDDDYCPAHESNLENYIAAEKAAGRWEA